MEPQQVVAFLDTDVLIDCLRGLRQAHAWLIRHRDSQLLIPGPVAMELVAGCRDAADLGKCRSFLSSFIVQWPDAKEFALGFEVLAAHRLSLGISIPGALIAAQAINRPATLWTFNTRHFQRIHGLDAMPPYDRESSPV